jgi:hypothetical protein
MRDRKIRIAIVDDPSVGQALKRLLRCAGFEVEC